MDRQLVVSTSPHLRAPQDIKTVMWSVLGALVPAIGISLYFFGAPALQTYAISILGAELTELACLRMRGEPLARALDGSALVTAVLLAMVLPPNVAWYCPLVGSVFAIGVVKHAFGGLGNNIWNPALAARVFLQFAYASQISLSEWPLPRRLWGPAVDALAQASPLAGEGAGSAYGYLDLLFGNGVPGSIGETCKVALIVGGVYLIVRRIVDWRIPLFYIGTVFVLTWILAGLEEAPAVRSDPVRRVVSDWPVIGGLWRIYGRQALEATFHVLAGGLIIGAFFMATDMVTTPMTCTGRVIFAVGCGVLVTIVRRYGGYPEGVAYSIVLMNTCTPLIDRWVRPRLYGSRAPEPARR